MELGKNHSENTSPRTSSFHLIEVRRKVIQESFQRSKRKEEETLNYLDTKPATSYSGDLLGDL